jgi:hypothetical protein
MATYIQGITDYIPRLQPFQPDFNFYTNALQTKEAQYKAGYEKLSNIYGTLLNSEMLRSDNIERRDQFFTQIDNEIKKIAGLDLSKEQNVSAAQKVFQPIIDDKYIQKDISYTKNWRNQQSRAEALKNCTDPKKCGGKWWDGGVRALNYQAEDFVKATADQSLSFQNPTYTPYVNVYEDVMTFAKEMGFERTEVTLTPDGKYRVTVKNGPGIVEDLTQTFMNRTLNNPQAIEMYKTQAYLDRKDFITGNASVYGSDEEAERIYLNDALAKINEQQKKLLKDAESVKTSISDSNKVAEKSINEVPVNDVVDQNFLDYLNNLNGQEESANGVANASTQALNETENAQNLDIESMRYRVDSAKAQSLLTSEMFDYASQYANLTMEQDITEDKYALASFDHGLKMEEIEYKAAIDYEMEMLKFDKQKELKLFEYTLENGGLPGSESTLDFNEQGIPVEPGPGGTGIPEGGAAAIAQQQVKAKMGDYDMAVQEKMTFVLSELDSIINNPGAYSKEQVASAKRQKEEIFGKAQVVSTPSTQAQRGTDALTPGAAAGGIAVAAGTAGVAAATVAAPLAAAGTVNVWNPIGWGLLAAAGVTAVGAGLYNYLSGDEETVPPTVTQGGYVDDSGRIVNVKGHVDASNPNSPYNIQNINKRLDSFIATEGNGLFRGKQTFKSRSTEINQRIQTADQMRQSAFKKARKDDLAIRQRLVGLYGNDGTELLIDETGHRRSEQEFINEYSRKYRNTIDNPMMNPAAKFAMDIVMDDAADVYETAMERYNRVYDRGEVPGLGIGVNTVGEGGGLVGRNNRRFSFDPAQPGPLRAVVKDLYLKDIAPALSNPTMKGALFTLGDATNITGEDEVNNSTQAQSIISNLLKESLSTKWKTKDSKRPLFDITRVGITQNNPNKVAVTFEIDQDFINKYDGSKDNPGITAGLAESGDNKVSLLLDRDKVTSTFFTSTEPTPQEFLLHNNGRVDVNAYNEFGGTGSIVKDPVSGTKSFTLTRKYMNPETGQLEELVMGDYGDFDVNDMYEKINLELASRYKQNFDLLRTPSKEQTNE